MYYGYDDERSVNLFISQEDIDDYFKPVDKEASDNGNNNPTNK